MTIRRPVAPAIPVICAMPDHRRSSTCCVTRSFMYRLVARSVSVPLLAPMDMPSLMEVEDAKETLQLVGKKVVARAAKRKAEALEASALRNAKLVELGQRRAAKRAAIAARPVKTHRSVDNVGRAYVF